MGWGVMFPAFAAMVLGGGLARFVLWPFEEKLEKRRFDRLAREMRDYMREKEEIR